MADEITGTFSRSSDESSQDSAGGDSRFSDYQGNGQEEGTEQPQHTATKGGGDKRKKRKKRNQVFTFNPLASYKGMAHRLFLIYKHIFGLLAGALIVHVENLSQIRKKGFRSILQRMSARLFKPFLRRDVRNLDFPGQLRKRLELLGPTYIKLGQIMAIREDLLPRVITEELEKLLDRLPEVPYHEIKFIVEESLEQPIGELFEQINENPIGSASIAQTHRATTKDGDDVVIKVIKPGIRDVVEIDLKLLKKLSGFLEWLVPEYQPEVIIKEFCKYTEREVDLTYEADNAELFAVNFQEWDDVVFPQIYRELSTRDVLTMTYLEGRKLSYKNAEILTQKEKTNLVETGAGSIIKMLYDDGFFHADLHPGNLLIMPGAKVGFLDLGMVGRFEEKTRRNLMYYFYTLVNGDVENSTKYLLNIARVGEGGDPKGFKRSVADLLRRYTIYAQMGEFSLGRLILESLRIGSSHKVFFPVEMTLMVKALITFEGVGLMLEPNLDIPTVSRKHVENIYRKQYNLLNIGQEMMQNSPEFIDAIIQMPKLISDGTRFLEENLNERVPEKHENGIRSAIIASAFLVSAVMAVIQGAHPVLWIILFIMGGIYALFGK